MLKLDFAVTDKAYRMEQAIISANMRYHMEMILGKPDEEGNFRSKKRLHELMKETRYLKDLKGKTVKVGNGRLSKDVAWEDILLDRYSDIYAKLGDKKHEYFFDEFGMGLIVSIIHAFENGIPEVLYNYYEISPELGLIAENMDGFDDEYYYTLVNEIKDDAIERIANEESNKEIMNLLKKDKADLDNVFKVYAEAYVGMFLDFSLYASDDCLDKFEFDKWVDIDGDKVTKKNADIIYDEFAGYFINPLFKDVDFETIMPLILSKTTLDYNLKRLAANNVGLMLGNADELTLEAGKDYCYDI